MLTGYLRKGESRPTLTGRAQRRHESRAQARAVQREIRGCGNPALHQAPRVIGHQQRALIAAANTGRMLVVDYLNGIGFPEADRYASAAGRATAKAYRKTHGRDPYAGCKVIVNGVVRSCMGYTDVADLHAGAVAYRRTATFLAEQQNTAVRELIAA